MSVWITVNGNRLDIVERPEYDERGIKNTPAAERAAQLVDIFNARGFFAEGPFHDEGRVPGAVPEAA